MEASYLVLVAILPIFLLIGSGTVARLVGWLDANADLSLMKVVVNLFYPALIFSKILGNEVLRKPSNLIMPPLLGFCMVLIGFAVAWLAIRQLKNVTDAEGRTFAFITGIQNSVYFGLPIIALLFNRETVGLMLVFNLGVEIAVWLIGVGFLLPQKGSRSLLKRLVSAPVAAIILATWMNYLGFDRELPDFALKTVRLLGQCAIPVGLMLIGALFADMKTNVKLFTRIDITLLSIAIRLAILPLIYLLSTFFLPLSVELERVIVVQAAMPCAVFPIVLAQHYGGSSDVALKVVLSTTFVSILTIPFWIKAGIALLGL